MQLKNNYYYFTSAISNDMCEKIINLGKTTIDENKRLGRDVRGSTFDNLEKQDNIQKKSTELNTLSDLMKNKNDNIRDNYFIRDSEISWLTDQWLYDLILPFVKEANNLAHWKFDIECFENFQFTVYNSPGGFYGWHKDGGSDHFAKYKRHIDGITTLDSFGKIKSDHIENDELIIGKVRKLSLTLNLSDDNEYEGGNLMFDFGKHEYPQFYECKEIRPKGSLVVFPSFTPHCVTPVTKGIRKSLVLWCLGKPFR
jgi:PKHD-type hydroxylase